MLPRSKFSLLTAISLLGIVSACGAPEDHGAHGTTREGAPASVPAPNLADKFGKAFQDPVADFSDTLPEGAGDGLNVYGTSEESRYFLYKPGYDTLWNSMVIRPERVGTVDWYVDQIQKNKARYVGVQNTTGVPWFWTGITHALEAGLDFGSHLHNGDPLSARTTHVPAGRPVTGTPPFTWEFSATDAISMKGYNAWRDWNLASMLSYAFERYNGFGYRSSSININSPYLWSFSNHYSRGKYTYDGYYDPNAVSQQAGALVILKRGIERGLWALAGASSGAQDQVRADATPALSRTLASGVSAPRDVALLQMRLSSYGFYAGAFDGAYSAATIAAVKAFQAFWGLSSDGVVGNVTWARLWPSVAEVGWLKAWRFGSEIGLHGMAGGRCLFKVQAREVPALRAFMAATTGAAAMTYGGEAEKSSLPNACPDARAVYDVTNRKIVAPTPPGNSPVSSGTTVTWHKLHKGAADAWHLNGFNGGTYVTMLSTKVKADVIKYLDTHTRAFNVLGALDTEVPVR